MNKHTPGPITFEGWFPPRDVGLLPSVKANWDGRTIQLFSDNLEQAEIDLKFLASAPELLGALEYCSTFVRDRKAYEMARQAIAKAKGEI